MVLDACRTPQQAIALLRVLNMAKVRHLSAVIGLAEEEGAEAFFSALESGLTAETQKKDRTTMPGMSENPFDKVFLVPPVGTDAAMTERLLERHATTLMPSSAGAWPKPWSLPGPTAAAAC